MVLTANSMNVTFGRLLAVVALALSSQQKADKVSKGCEKNLCKSSIYAIVLYDTSYILIIIQ